MAWVAVCSAWAAVALIHDTYGAAAAAIDADDGPVQPLVSVAIVEPYDDAVAYSSEASASQAAAAASIGPDPGPAYIRPELISGGNSPKSNIEISPRQTRYWAAIALAASVAAYDPALVVKVLTNIS